MVNAKPVFCACCNTNKVKSKSAKYCRNCSIYIRDTTQIIYRKQAEERRSLNRRIKALKEALDPPVLNGRINFDKLLEARESDV